MDFDTIADSFAAHHIDVGSIQDLHSLTDALLTIGIDVAVLTSDQIDKIISQIDEMLAQHPAGHSLKFAGNPGWYQGSSGTWYHNDPSGHYDGKWSK